MTLARFRCNVFLEEVGFVKKTLVARAGLTIVPVVPWEGAPRPPPGGPDQLPNFYHTVLTFKRSVGLNVTTKKKKGS